MARSAAERTGLQLCGSRAEIMESRTGEDSKGASCRVGGSRLSGWPRQHPEIRGIFHALRMQPRKTVREAKSNPIRGHWEASGPFPGGKTYLLPRLRQPRL